MLHFVQGQEGRCKQAGSLLQDGRLPGRQAVETGAIRNQNSNWDSRRHISVRGNQAQNNGKMVSTDPVNDAVFIPNHATDRLPINLISCEMRLRSAFTTVVPRQGYPGF